MKSRRLLPAGGSSRWRASRTNLTQSRDTSVVFVTIQARRPIANRSTKPSRQASPFQSRTRSADRSEPVIRVLIGTSAVGAGDWATRTLNYLRDGVKPDAPVQ